MDDKGPSEFQPRAQQPVFAAHTAERMWYDAPYLDAFARVVGGPPFQAPMP
jgi:hypothetical protein